MTSLQYSLKTVYVETILMLKQDSPFKSVSMFYYGLVNQSDVTALADIDLDIPERKLLNLAAIEGNVHDINSPISVDECTQLVDIYKRYCYNRKSSKFNSASPFTSIKQFYSGLLGLSVDDMNRIERGRDRLDKRDLQTITQVQMMAIETESERVHLAWQAAREAARQAARQAQTALKVK
jgi:hypothetical protein